MEVAIDNALLVKIENRSKKTFAIIPKSTKIANVFFREWLIPNIQYSIYFVVLFTLDWLVPSSDLLVFL